jgi:CRP/FNR family cyclic AMP-dependent transcriptional regulator
MLIDELRSVPLFADLTDEERARVADVLAETDADLGTVLAREGDFAYHLFVVRAGLAAVTVDGQLRTTLGPGDSFGEIGVIERGQRTADVVAVTPMRLLTMKVWEFNKLSEEVPAFASRAKELAQQRLDQH